MSGKVQAERVRIIAENKFIKYALKKESSNTINRPFNFTHASFHWNCHPINYWKQHHVWPSSPTQINQLTNYRNIWRCRIYQPIISALLHRGGKRSLRSSAPVSDMTTERNLLAQMLRRDFLRLQLCVLCGQLSRDNRSAPLKWFECLLSTIPLQVLLQDYNIYIYRSSPWWCAWAPW